MKKIQRKSLQIVVMGAVALCSLAGMVSADEGEKVKTQSAFRPVLEPGPAAKRGPKLVRANIFPLYDKLVRGEPCLVAVQLVVKDGWHIVANPSKSEFARPTELKMKTKQKVKLTQVKYPKDKEHRMEGEDEPYHVYDGKVFVYALLEPDATEVADKAKLEFHIRYQACNDTECVMETIVMKGALSLANPGDEIKVIHADKFPKTKQTEAPKKGAKQ